MTEDGVPTASGSLSVSDADSGQSVFAPVEASALIGSYGTWSFSSSGAWSYLLNNDNASVEALVTGSTLTDSLTVQSVDRSDSETITVTINGASYPASISGTSTGSVTEDGVPTASGSLSVSDADSGQSVFAPVEASALIGSYGTWSFSSSGAWSYLLNNDNASVEALVTGSTLTDSLTVQSVDLSDSETITVTINGASYPASISGTSTGSVTEDGVLTASGSLSVSDADSGQSVFAPVEASALIGSYGTWSFIPAPAPGHTSLTTTMPRSRRWSTGSSLTDSLTVQSFDGSDSEIITVTINGASYLASISGTNTGLVTEDGVLTASGSLSVSDADSGQSVFAPVEASALIGSYGTWNFNSSSGAWSYLLDNNNASVEALSTGSSLTDSLTVQSFDGSDSEIITVTINGASYLASISGTNTGLVTEDGVLTASGSLSVSDADSGQSVFAPVEASALIGSYGTWNFNSSSGAWSYLLDNNNASVEALSTGSSLTDSLTVQSFDGSDSEIITVTINGASYLASISGTNTGLVTEDGVLTASGSLSVSDADSGQSVFAPVEDSALIGSYGTWNFNSSSGAWSYLLDNNNASVEALSTGSSLTDSLTVQSFDGSDSEIITVTINGASYLASISGTNTGLVTEDGVLTASGSLSVSDADSGQSVFAPVEDSALIGSYGTWNFNSSSGAWSYLLDNNNASVEALSTGSSLTDSLTVQSFDGSDSEIITVTINGASYLASISGTNTGLVTEDGVLTASGSLSVSDADSGQSVFAPVEASALIGSYGTWNFNSSSGAWSYLLDNNNASVEALSTGSSLTDSLTVQSFDGSDSEIITVTINGASYLASISGTNTGLVTEDGCLPPAAASPSAMHDNDQSVFAPVEAPALSRQLRHLELRFQLRRLVIPP